ncbi:MAG: N-acetyl-gamma-glutamyl-phosphate reductase [Cyclobacteriaceae bacterium]
MSKKKIAIAGATGYTGSELVRILHNHPDVDIIAITSESRAGEAFSSIHPQFMGICDMPLIQISELNTTETDLVFLALPHGVSMEFAAQLRKKNVKVVDLSGDFRLSTPEVYAEWYHKKHSYEEGIAEAVFGLPELYSNEIRNASLVANPGCYPTSAILAISPLLQRGLVKHSPVIIDAKSGVTGAGVKPGEVSHFSNVHDNFRAYGLKNHRHTIEIQEQLSKAADSDVIVQFTPHLLPIDRGILSTIYLQPSQKISDEMLHKVFFEAYLSAPFVHICESPPQVKDVRGSNFCNIYSTFDERTGLIVVIAAIDNLVKGAAGQAVQNMNLMLGLHETSGLNHIPLRP